MLLLVTLVWGATFIWMREIMLALETDLERIGTTAVVAFLISSRFALAAAVLPLFPSVRRHPWQPGGVEGRLCSRARPSGRILGTDDRFGGT